MPAAYPQITNVQIVDTVEEAVRDSDLVTYCNSGETGDPSTYPEVKREWVKPGAFLAMPASCRLDEGMEQFDVRKVMDNKGLYEAWLEEVPKPTSQHHPLAGMRFMDMIDAEKMSASELEDLGEIVAGVTRRKNDEEIIVMSVGGMPVEDVAWATKIYRNAVEKGIGVLLNLWDQPVLS
ncbi:hypothetical protein P4S64_14965 [Vibrio sp. M60_M31a]